MSHEICFVKGKACIFTVGEGGWHGLGETLDKAPTLQAAIDNYGLDYPLVKQPWFRPAPSAPSGWQESGDTFYVQRTDTGAVLGSVGSNYEIVTNRQAFETIRPLVDNGTMTIETGGVLREGADAWLLCRWKMELFGKEVQEVFKDEVAAFSAIMANHNGRRGILLGNTPIRIVCANTLGAAENTNANRWENIRHTKDAGSRLVEAAQKVFHGVLERYETIAKQYKLLKATRLTTEKFKELVLDVVAPDPRLSPKFNPESKLAEVVVSRVDNKRAKLTELWTSGKGHTGDNSAWEAYNSVTQAIDHETSLWPNRDGTWQSRGLLGSTYSNVKQEVLNGLVEFSLPA